MSDTPITDKHQSDCLRTGGRSCDGGKNAYWLARRLETALANALLYCQANQESNQLAEWNASKPEDKIWSCGVAAGFKSAANEMEKKISEIRKNVGFPH